LGKIIYKNRPGVPAGGKKENHSLSHWGKNPKRFQACPT
jgi:hypothetical protein